MKNIIALIIALLTNNLLANHDTFRCNIWLDDQNRFYDLTQLQKHSNQPYELDTFKQE